MSYALGIDLGGSSAKLGVVSAGGDLVAHDVVALPAAADAGQLLAPVVAAARQLSAAAASRGARCTAVGCGVPGNLDAARATVLLNNIPALDGFALRPWLQQAFALPVVLDNDTCMAAWAEVAAAGMAAGRTLVVTVGSGIGVVLVADGAIVRVAHGATGEAGHLIVAPRGHERCPLGCRGCLETVASARAIERAGERAARRGTSPPLAARLAAGGVSAADVARAAAAGDRAARSILGQAGAWLGLGLASWAAIYAPDTITLGGGVAQAGQAWLRSATRAMRERGVPGYTRTIVVQTARLGPRAGVIGAGLSALQPR